MPRTDRIQTDFSEVSPTEFMTRHAEEGNFTEDDEVADQLAASSSFAGSAINSDDGLEPEEQEEHPLVAKKGKARRLPPTSSLVGNVSGSIILHDRSITAQPTSPVRFRDANMDDDEINEELLYPSEPERGCSERSSRILDGYLKRDSQITGEIAQHQEAGQYAGM